MSTIEDDLFRSLWGGWRIWRARRASQAVASILGPWCQENGFVALEPLHPDVIDRWSEALLLVDADQEREAGTALHRRHARGDLYLFDSFSTGRAAGRASTAVVTTSAATRTVRSDDVLDGLPRGSALQRTPRSLVVHVPRPLTVALAERLARRLGRLEAALPAAPGTTRL
jgi:hypothetical protein